MRIRFASSRSIFAPSQEETSCGTHALRFIVPPDASLYTATVYLIHIDGEGMADPPYTRLFPQNLVNHNDGPRFFNLKVQGLTGALHVPAPYLRDRADDLDSFHMRSAGDPVWSNGKRSRERSATPPPCQGGEAPGRWVFHHSIYPDVPGEPLEWRPYGCVYRRISGQRLRDCLESWGSTKLLGESTLGQMHDTWHQHLNGSTYYWRDTTTSPLPSPPTLSSSSRAIAAEGSVSSPDRERHSKERLELAAALLHCCMATA